MIDQNDFYSLSLSDRWRLFRDNQDRLENAKNKIEALRAKLVKAEIVIDIASKHSVGWLYAWKNEFNDAYDNYQETRETK